MLTRKGTTGQRRVLARQLWYVRWYIQRGEHIAWVAAEWGRVRGMVVGYDIPLRLTTYLWMRRHIWDTL